MILFETVIKQAVQIWKQIADIFRKERHKSYSCNHDPSIQWLAQPLAVTHAHMSKIGISINPSKAGCFLPQHAQQLSWTPFNVETV